ncbi:alpha/beta hydrolase [Sphingomonas sp.]|uniref:alpha/beta fold hydrolase n=1 Tax=Sphingomonas sp. TaxID=28214 RepID=UPI001859CD60|nr:alpha/beta hydrolase [Sphingomonas sp.]MBA3511169.1 alpha/beta hydrolase [Sphingomonas sp.]
MSRSVSGETTPTQPSPIEGEGFSAEFRRIRLATGVTLNVALAGDPHSKPVILLHGFPESHRTWRGVAPLLEDRFRLVMPDLRGFAGSDRPQEVDAYQMKIIVEDIFALADALSIERFALVGHDWGGAAAWAAAIRGNPRIERLAIVNSPHPVIFQKSLIESAEQRSASQYINAFRAPGFEKLVEAMGYDEFFEKSFGAHVDLALIPEAEKRQYIAEWSQPGALTAMLNWYRAAPLVVPPPLVTVPIPDWVLAAFPKVRIPTLVVWGMRDRALLPVQLEGLERLVEDLTVVRLPDAGHFAPWEAPEPVAQALEHFLEREPAATAPIR